MTLEERNEFTLRLGEIYASARQKIELLRDERTAARRKKLELEEFSVHVEETRALQRLAFNEILGHLRNFDSASLPTLTALYFHELSNLKYEVTALKESRIELRNELDEKRRRLREEVTKRREIKDQLMDAKFKLRSAKLDRQKGAAIKHKENRAMKAEVFEWLNENRSKFKSMDKTAEAITKLQPIAFRTARDWVGDWKKLRSAGTP